MVGVGVTMGSGTMNESRLIEPPERWVIVTLCVPLTNIGEGHSSMLVALADWLRSKSNPSSEMRTEPSPGPS